MEDTIKKWWIITIVGVISLNAGGFALSGTGTRELSLGGASRSGAEGPYAIFWNPSLIANTENKELSLSLLEIIPFVTIYPNTGLLAYDGPYSKREKVENKFQMFSIPALGYIHPFEKFTAGFSVSVPFGLGASYDLYDFPVGFESNNEYPKYDWESDLKVIAILIGIAKTFGKFNLGLSFGPTYSEIKLRQVHLATADTNLPVQYVQFPVDQIMKGKGVGFGGILGISYEFSEKFRLGFSLRGFSKANLKGKVNLGLYTPKNDYIKNYILSDGDPANDEDTLYWKGILFKSEGDAKTKLPLPFNIGLGMKYSPSPKLNIYFDVDYTTWSMLDRIPIELEGKDPKGEDLENDTLILEWKDILRLSLGTEYFVKEFWALRFGFYYDPSPVNEKTLDPLIPDVGDKFSFNIGSGFIFNKFSFDLNYEFIYSPEKELEGIEDVDRDGEFDNFPGKYKNQVHAFGLSINYSF